MYHTHLAISAIKFTNTFPMVQYPVKQNDTCPSNYFDFDFFCSFFPAEVLPYLVRRAQENSTLMQGAMKERQLLLSELKRRLGLTREWNWSSSVDRCCPCNNNIFYFQSVKKQAIIINVGWWQCALIPCCNLSTAHHCAVWMVLWLCVVVVDLLLCNYLVPGVEILASSTTYSLSNTCSSIFN